MTDQIKDQLFFAEVKKRSVENGLEVARWDGYCQGLKFCLGVLSGITRYAEHIPAKEPIPCTCDPEILQPFGQCLCNLQEPSNV